MATVLEFVQSVETLLGNRRDVRDMCVLAVNDAFKIVKSLQPSPEHQIIVDIQFDQGDYIAALPSTVDSISDCSYYSFGDPTYVPDGEWVPLDKGNPSVFLTYPDETMPPLKWFQFGRDLWIWPAHDITGTHDEPNTNPPPATVTVDTLLTVRCLCTRTHTLALGDEVPINQLWEPALRQLALMQAKIMLGQPEAAAVINRFVRDVLQPAMSLYYRSQQHGNTGFKPRLE